MNHYSNVKINKSRKLNYMLIKFISHIEVNINNETNESNQQKYL